MIQGSDEWRKARLGRVTASRISDIVAKTKNGWASARKNYAADLVCERLTGIPTNSFVNDAMKWGTENEPHARDAYTDWLGVGVEQVGFIDHPSIAMSGASPDGLVGPVGALEIKCPNTATHIDTLLTKKIPEKYLYQMQWQMACTGREWVDYCSYDPRMPESLRLFVQRVKREDRLIADLEANVQHFLAEVDATIEALGNLERDRHANHNHASLCEPAEAGQS